MSAHTPSTDPIPFPQRPATAHVANQYVESASLRRAHQVLRVSGALVVASAVIVALLAPPGIAPRIGVGIALAVWLLARLVFAWQRSTAVLARGHEIFGGRGRR